MPKSTNPSVYPEAFWTIAQGVKVGKELRVEFEGDAEESAKQAQALRFSWYGFVKALKKAEAQEYSKATGIEVLFKSGGVMGGAWLVFRSRDDPKFYPQLNAAVAEFVEEHGEPAGPTVNRAGIDEAVAEAARKLTSGDLT